MTVIELARLLNHKISQGKGNWEVTVHQWHEGFQPLDEIMDREANETIELYSQPDCPVTDDFDELI